ncbi:MAG: hypothetical protein ACLQFW_15035 [Xanthobacteraceae bacterium]
MAFEIRKINDVGVGHPVVARLGVQAGDLIPWIDIEEAKRKEIAELYGRTLTDRLLRCRKFRDDLVNRANEAAESVKPQKDKRVREVPHVIGLQGIAEGFLYEAKNYLRDLLNLFRIVYGCELTDASAFTNLKGEGDSELVNWAVSTFGSDHDLTKLLRTEQEWIAETIRMRNAVEHPGGLSGTLTVNNIRIDPNQPNSYIPPTWARTGRAESNIAKDMDCNLDNMLTLAEDLLVGVVMDKSKSKNLITVREIPKEDRNPKCPIRLRVEPSTEVLGQLPAQQPPSPVKSEGRQLSGKQLLRQQDRAWRERKKRES